MVSPEVLTYIQSLLRNGYREDQIRSYLLSSGYTQADIEAAFTNLSHELALSPARPSRPPWLWIAGAVLGLGVGGILVALLFAAPAAEFSLSATPLQVQVRAGESLSIKDTLRSSGPQTLRVTHTILDPSNLPIGSPESEEVTVSGTQDRTFSLDVPASAAPGRYTVQVSAIDSSGTESSTSFAVSVVAARVSCVDGIKNQAETGIDCGGQCRACPQLEQPAQPNITVAPVPPAPVEPVTVPSECGDGCNDYDISTNDACVENKCVYTPKPAVCGNGICNADETANDCPQDCGAGPNAPSADQVIEDAKTVAPQDAERATGLCSALPRPQDKDRCFSVVASSAGNSELCATIVEDITRDQCYIDFALSKNQFEVCEKIVNRYLRGSCNSLRNLRQLEQERAQPTQTSCPSDRPVACTSDVNTVCGDNNRQYDNACFACIDFTVRTYYDGACQ